MARNTGTLLLLVVVFFVLVVLVHASSSSVEGNVEGNEAGNEDEGGGEQEGLLLPLPLFAVELTATSLAEATTDAERALLARQLADELDMDFVSQVAHFQGVYLFRGRAAAAVGPSSIASREEISDFHARRLSSFARNISWFDEQKPRKRYRRGVSFNDPSYPRQWHLNSGSVDINVIPTWEQGITGSGIVVCMVDDGLDYHHPDIAPQYVPEASYDWNYNDPDPFPTHSDDIHGTRCAGEIAAAANNTACGVGVAYGAKLSAGRILSSAISDAVEANALSYKPQINYVYSNSWGPWDNGATVESPGPLGQRAFFEGVTNGRNGLGSVYVFASGNGGTADNCNFDGYTNSIYTISIGAIGRDGVKPYYEEYCAAHLAVAPSSNSKDYITTNDVNYKCTNQHGGTSAAAPIAAGIIALIMEIRDDLSWRDFQWLIVKTARKVAASDPDWKKNGAGYEFNHQYGFGLLDATAMVELAKTWPKVGQQVAVAMPMVELEASIPQGPTGIEFYVDVSEDAVPEDFLHLEHVTVTFSMTHSRRGDVIIELISPAGTLSVLATRRAKDASDEGLKNWVFMTVKNWGEPMVGRWTLRVTDNSTPTDVGRVTGYGLTFFGESSQPIVWKSPETPTEYAPEEPTPTATDPLEPTLPNPTAVPTTPSAPTDAPTMTATDAPTTTPPIPSDSPTEASSLSNASSSVSSVAADDGDDEDNGGKSVGSLLDNLSHQQKVGLLVAVLLLAVCLFAYCVYWIASSFMYRRYSKVASDAAEEEGDNEEAEEAEAEEAEEGTRLATIVSDRATRGDRDP